MELLELSISNLTELLRIIPKEKEYTYLLDFYTDLLSIALNKSVEEIDELDFDEHNRQSSILIEKLAELNHYKEFPNEIRIGTTIYTTSAIDNQFNFKTKEFKAIQSIIGTQDYVLDFAAIVWREENGDLTKDSIANRKMIFKDKLKIKDIIAYINKFSEYVKL